MDVKKIRFCFVILTLLHCCNEAVAIVCTKDFCKLVKCVNEAVCESNQLLKPGGLCNCCLRCITILKENEQCSSLLQALQGVPKMQECAKGLVCLNNSCQRVDLLTKNRD